MSESIPALRPQTFDDFIGQEAVKDRLQVHINAAWKQDRPLPHVFLFGRPGFGKTSLAGIIANEMLGGFTEMKMSEAMKAKDFYASIEEFAETGGVLFLDEIHATPKGLQEDLFLLLEDGYIQTNGPGRSRIDMPTLNGYPAVTVIGATTERGKVIAPLYDRFKIKPEFDPYTPEEMTQIVYSMARKVPGGPLELDEQTAVQLGAAAGGTPRKAQDLVLAARDLAAADRELSAASVLRFCRIDPEGLSDLHLQYLGWLYQFRVPTGLSTLTNVMYLHERVLRDLERLLLEKKLIVLTKSGRELTQAGRIKVLAALGEPETKEITRRRRMEVA